MASSLTETETETGAPERQEADPLDGLTFETAQEVEARAEDAEQKQEAAVEQSGMRELKTKFVHRVMGRTMALPNLYLMFKLNEPPLQSLDIDQYDKQYNGLAVKASAQIADMIDLSDVWRGWLERAVEWEEKYGDIGIFAGAVLQSAYVEWSARQEVRAQQDQEKSNGEAGEGARDE